VSILALYRQDDKQIKKRRSRAAWEKIRVKGWALKKKGTVLSEDRPHEIVQRELD